MKSLYRPLNMLCMCTVPQLDTHWSLIHINHDRYTVKLPLAAKMSHRMCSLFWQHLNINLVTCHATKLWGATAHLTVQTSHQPLLLWKQATLVPINPQVMCLCNCCLTGWCGRLFSFRVIILRPFSVTSIEPSSTWVLCSPTSSRGNFGGMTSDFVCAF